MASETIRQFREWFWRPPRAHEEIIHDRSVSFLELLYDLVYVAVVSQAADTLAADVSVTRFIEFAIVFTLIWIAWINGSLYLELHGREDGRTRSFVFVQMGILALIAVFAANAATTSGTAFAVAYVAFLLVQAWMWNSVRGQDTPEVARVTRQYVIALLTMAALIGVVDGMSHAEQDVITIGTGTLALFIGLGFWWIYFDIVGRRLPREGGRCAVQGHALQRA